MPTLYTLLGRLQLLERNIHKINCYLKSQQGGEITESDPVFSQSPASGITQENIEFLTTLDYNSLNNIPNRTPQMITTNVSEYNLVPTGGTILITFYGTTTNLILPTVADHLGQVILLYNGGTGDVTISSNPNDGDVVVDGGMTMNSTNLTSGSPMTLFSSLVGNDPRWIAKP